MLDGLIADALAHNLNVQIAAANVEQAAAVLTQAKAPLYPQASYGGDAAKRAGVRDGGDADPGRASRTRRPRTRSSPGRAGRSTSGAGSAASPRRRGRSCSPPRRRGAASILSLVAVGGERLRPAPRLDEQLVIARRTKDAYGIMPDAASMDRTRAVTDRTDAIFGETPGVGDRMAITGYSLLDGGLKTNAGTIFATLKPYDERYDSMAKAQRRERGRGAPERLREEPGDQGGPRHPGRAPGDTGHRDDGRLRVLDPGQGRGGPRPARPADPAVPRRARERPELAGLNTTFRANTLQLRAEVDREKTTLLGVPISDVYSTIQAQFGSLTASQYNQFSRVWWVVLQSDPKYRQTPGDLGRLYVRSSAGADGAALGPREDDVGQGPRPPAALQRAAGGEDQRRGRSRLQLGPGHRRHGGGGAGGAPRGLRASRGRASPSRRSSRGARPRPPSPSA